MGADWGPYPRLEGSLRQALPRWLTTAPLCNIVRAFAPAQLRDGGAGASYVLLA